MKLSFASVPNIAPDFNSSTRHITSDIASLELAILSLGGLGGSGKVATDLAKGFATAGAKVSVLTSSEPQWGADRDPLLDYVPVNAPKTPTEPDRSWIVPLAYDIMEQIETREIKVLNVHYAVGLIEAALLARQALAARGYRLAVCLTLHGSDVTGFGRRLNYGSQLRECIAACDRVTAVSSWLADQAVEILALKKRPTVIHNSVDLKLFRPLRIRDTTRSKQILNLCHVSNFRSVKRPLDAIQVLARVRGAGVRAQLFMIGDGLLIKEAREYARELNVAEDVMFLGTASPNELVHWLSVTDMMLVTSESESFCLAALEAMACGVPVMGTYCGGLEEVVKELGADLPDKLLSPLGDTATMATKIVQMFKSPVTYEMICDRLTTMIKIRFCRSTQLQAYGHLLSELQQGVGE
ncbi:N-acetyl-alpha-D-glucosaminyl L-malate synthase [Scytonema hofmannii PCC 7110]|uniref:N-acetyl-alpha-D-glucosaminyl L-malate synthase n=1 Tax=Scytonema hofmannii PCC 7110 TaxID=128403 RepID=A0A139X7I5_9CYAN|nr:glycosyltransferase [Scytonema hofmannii]KYC40603.1 N-acetyl-alpha-D-glucosaminyl L-malate synthase [Scytonema hofmannii PCC 7110]